MPRDYNQSIPLPVDFIKGVNTKVDPRRLKPPFAADIVDMDLDEYGTLKTRRGHTALANSQVLTDPVSFGVMSSCVGLGEFDDELLLADGDYLYTYSETQNEYWRRRGQYTPVGTTAEKILYRPGDQQGADSATLNGFTVVAWGEGSVVYAAIFDSTNGATLVGAHQIDTTTASSPNPRVVAFSTKICVFYANSGNRLGRYEFDTTNIFGSLSNSPSTLTSTLDSDTDFDLAYDSVSGWAVLAFRSYATTSNHLYMGWIDEAGTLSGLTDMGYVLSELSVAVNAAGDEIAVSGTGTFVSGSETGQLRTNVTFSSTTTQYTSDTADSTVVAYDSNDASRVLYTKNGHTYYFTDPGLTTVDLWHMWVVLSAKPFLYNDNLYVVGVHLPDHSGAQTGLQRTHVVVKFSTGELVAQSQSGNTDHNSYSHGKPTVNQLDSTTFRLPVGEVDISGNADLAFLTIDFDPVLTQPIRFGDSVYFPGSVPMMYDGKDIVEDGFIAFPETVSAVQQSSGSMNPDSEQVSYGYLVIYEWINWRGERIQSTGVQYSQGLASSQHGMDISVPSISLHRKADEIKIVLYRTEANGSAYYRLAAVDNDPTTTGYQVYSDTTSDSDLIENEECYVDTEVDHVLPSPSTVMVSSHYHAFSNDSDLPNRVQCSKTLKNGRQLVWNDSQVFDVDPAGGAITALGVLDSALIIFKERRIYAQSLSSLPNDSINGGAGFSTPELVSADTGCTDPRTVTITPDGLLFQAKDGIQLLDRTLSLKYVGAPVEDYNDQTFTAASVVPDRNQVRFLAASGRTLVYHYDLDAWTTYTTNGVDAIVHNSRYYFADSSGYVYQENTDSSSDYRDTSGAGSTAYDSIVETPWLHIREVQGWQRIRRMELLVEVGQTGAESTTLDIEVFYDYEDTAQYTLSHDVAGFDTIRHRPQRGKCRAIKFKFTLNADSSDGDWMSLSQLMLEVRPRGGVGRVPSGYTL